MGKPYSVVDKVLTQNVTTVAGWDTFRENTRHTHRLQFAMGSCSLMPTLSFPPHLPSFPAHGSCPTISASGEAICINLFLFIPDANMLNERAEKFTNSSYTLISTFVMTTHTSQGCWSNHVEDSFWVKARDKSRPLLNHVYQLWGVGGGDR